MAGRFVRRSHKANDRDDVPVQGLDLGVRPTTWRHTLGHYHYQRTMSILIYLAPLLFQDLVSQPKSGVDIQPRRHTFEGRTTLNSWFNVDT